MKAARTNHQPETYYQIERLVNYSDAVIAIAVTLLILPLVDRASELQSFTVNDLLQSTGQQFLIFLLSFVVICRYWLIHHRLFHNLKAFNGTLFWLNSLWLLTIVVIPFPTELIGKAPSSNGLVAGFYIAVLFITSLTGLLIQWQIRSNPQLRKSSTVELSLADSVAAVILLLIALIVTILFPHVGPLSLLLLLLSGPASKALRSVIKV